MRVYQGSVFLLSSLIAGLGVAMLVATAVAGGGPLSAGTVMGVAFLGVGGGRLYMALRARR